MKKNILIIEDEQDLRFLLGMSLKEAGFNVEEAIDGKGAFGILKKKKIDLILLDIILPDVNGFEILTKLKKDPKLESIPVIILSNLGQKEEIEKGLKLGADGYLIKADFTLSQIVKTVKKILK